MKQDDIIALLREQNEQGLEELLKHSGPLMKYIISPIISDSHEREDCLSEAAMRVWENIGQFDSSRGSWNAWLTAVTRNTALSRAEKSRRYGSRLEDMSESIASSAPTPEEHVLLLERKAALRRALAALEPRDRLLFYRKYYYRQSTAQIASELGLTERAVEGRLYRLKKQLRNSLGGEGYER